ncbi:hypothetical protein [Phenylobacterium ferrooxidans]|uniref:Peptidase n=1 Tax=Phenylobacterium ferrooxidans TaxID=2982689 RepID=A0ABW6CKA9_9CAUL
MSRSIQAFKAGRHRASDGKVYAFTEADVAGMAASYDPALQAAPIVLGHPKTDDPAWGWVKGLSVVDGVLVAEPEKLAPEFTEGVEAGRYRYVSAAFYAPSDDRNPKPGAWYLRHLGYLGAQPPAVKGLQAAFDEDAAPAVEFSQADGFWVKDIFRSMRDFFIEKFGLEVADRVIPGWSVENVETTPPAPAFAEVEAPILAAEPVEAAAAFIEEASAPAPADADPQADLTARAAELDAREAELNARAAQFSEADRTEARAADGAFVDELVSAGRLPPAQRDRVAGLFARLGGDETVAFAEADADPRAELRALLGGLGVSITFAEVAAGDGFDGRLDPADLARRAGELVTAAQARGETLSYATAVARAQTA